MKLKGHGFTLIELMIVISILGILATMAMPSFQDRIIRTQMKEAFNLGEIAKKAVEDYYDARGTLPQSNAAAGLPQPDKIIGNCVRPVRVIDGAIDITLGNRINKNVDGKTVTVRPAIVEGTPVVPIAWVHGYASVPQGMAAMGTNNTNVLPRHLPVYCRY
ncbi:MAG: pilin [Desulfobacterales bacterium]|jgi:type IV pilus assembly protein PilA